MEKFANGVFYILTFLAFASSLVILISKETRTYITSAVVAFASIGGLYLILNSPGMFVIQIVFFALGTGAILYLCGRRIEEHGAQTHKKAGMNLTPGTFLAPVMLCVFILICTPFIINQMSMQEINSLFGSDIWTRLKSEINLNLILISIFILAVLSGFYTIAFWRKK